MSTTPLSTFNSSIISIEVVSNSLDFVLTSFFYLYCYGPGSPWGPNGRPRGLGLVPRFALGGYFPTLLWWAWALFRKQKPWSWAWGVLGSCWRAHVLLKWSEESALSCSPIIWEGCSKKKLSLWLAITSNAQYLSDVLYICLIPLPKMWYLYILLPMEIATSNWSCSNSHHSKLLQQE